MGLNREATRTPQPNGNMNVSGQAAAPGGGIGLIVTAGSGGGCEGDLVAWGFELLSRLLPRRQLRTNPCVVKSKYTMWHVKRAQHRDWPNPPASPTRRYEYKR